MENQFKDIPLQEAASPVNKTGNRSSVDNQEMNSDKKQGENDAFLGNGSAKDFGNGATNGDFFIYQEDEPNQNNNDGNGDIVTRTNNSEGTNKSVDSPSKNNANKNGKFLRSSAFILYVGHFLSSWGDRMWTFAVAVFLIGLDSDSLRLPALYGLSIGASGLLFKTLVGDWVDRTPRMKTVVVALAVQNVSVAACAGVVILLLLLKPDATLSEAAAVAAGLAIAPRGGGGRVGGELEDNGPVMEADAVMASELGTGSGAAGWNSGGVGGGDWWWYSVLCQAAIIAIACIANLASSAMKISIQKDWIVIVSGSADDLAQMNSVIRTIDLLAKILAPIATGVIMSGASHVIGAAFIAAWNLISLVAEYVILRKVYLDNPALKIKAVNARDQVKEVTSSERNGENRSKLINKKEDENEDKEENKEMYESEKIALTEREKTENEAAKYSPGAEAEKVAEEHVKAKPSITKTTTTTTTKKTQGILHSNLLTILVSGWSTYMRHGVRNAGLGLAFLYMTVLGFDSITIGYAYSQGLCASWLGGLQASGAVMGILGTLSFPSLRRRCGLERTGLFASSLQISCLCLCLVSIFLPGSPFVLLRPDATASNSSDVVDSTTSSFVNVNSTSASRRETAMTMTTSNLTDDLREGTQEGIGLLITKKQCVETPHGSYISIGVMMAGIILARFGLWNLDLTITQILQEQVEESERGIVNGVQHSLQDLLDMIKFILVIFIPHPKHFAYLVILSFVFVTTGGVFYTSYATRDGGPLARSSLLSNCAGQQAAPSKSKANPVHV